MFSVVESSMATGTHQNTLGYTAITSAQASGNSSRYRQRWVLTGPMAQSPFLQDAVSSFKTSDFAGTLSIFLGHSMVIDHMTKILYIFAGQREDKYLSDMYAYDTKTGIATEIFSNFTISGGPEASFTQRAVIDPALKEIYIFCGLTRFSHSIPCGMPESVVSSQAQAMLRDSLLDWVYRYDSRPGKWMRSLRIPDQPARQRPRPRFAHQVVYNPRTRTVFLHGGNAGESKDKSIRTVDDTAGGQREDEQLTDAKDDDLQERLDDFWKMNLKRSNISCLISDSVCLSEFFRPGPEGVIRMSRFAIRKQQ